MDLLPLPTGIPPRAAAGRPAPLLVTLLLVALLTACAGVPYQPYAGTDAARLRLRLAIPDAYRAWTSPYRVQASVAVRRVERGSCAEPLSLPTLRTHHPGVAAVGSAATGLAPTPPVTYPRAGMRGGTPADHSESVELALAPGPQVVTLHITRQHGNLATTTCSAAVEWPLQPGGEHELLLGFNDRGQCHWTARRLEGAAFVAASTVRDAESASQLCAARR